MKNSKIVSGIVALVFVFLLLLLIIAHGIYDMITQKVVSEIVMDCLYCFFTCLCMGFGIFHYRKFRKRLPAKSDNPEDTQSLEGMRYKIAMEQLNCIIFDYSILENVIKLSSDGVMDARFPSAASGHLRIMPEFMIRKNIIHPDSCAQFLRMFSDIRGGKPSSYCSVQMRNAEKQYRWCKITLTCIYDNYHDADCAFGIVEDITEQKETEKRFIKEHQYREAILSSAITTYKLNISKNKLKRGQENWMELFGIQPTDNYSVMVESMAEKGVFPEDAEPFLKTFSLDSILSAFSCGQTEITLDYRHKPLHAPGGWVRCTLHLLRDPFTQEIKGIAYIKDINKQKKKEIRLKFLAERDSLSGLYNRGAFRQLITDFLNSEDGKTNMHALLIVDIDNFKSINDSHGHIQGDVVLKDVANCMKAIFRSTDIIGRLGGDEYVLFMKNIFKPEAAVCKAKELNEALKSLHINNNAECVLSVSIGIAQCPGNGLTFDELYHNADIALYQAKKNGKNDYVLFPASIANSLIQK